MFSKSICLEQLNYFEGSLHRMFFEWFCGKQKEILTNQIHKKKSGKTLKELNWKKVKVSSEKQQTRLNSEGI